MSSSSPDLNRPSVDRQTDSRWLSKSIVSKFRETRAAQVIAKMLHRAQSAPNAHQSLKSISETVDNAHESGASLAEADLKNKGPISLVSKEIDANAPGRSDSAHRPEGTFTYKPTSGEAPVIDESRVLDVEGTSSERNMNIIPSVEFPDQNGVAYLRFTGVDDLHDLLREQGGIHLPNHNMKKSHHSDRIFPTTYFHLAGKLSKPSFNIDPREDGSSRMKFHPVEAEMVMDGNTRKGYRYGVGIVIRVTPANFNKFSGKIIEQQQGELTTYTHEGEKIRSYDKLGTGSDYAVIDTESLTKEDLQTLGNDLQLAIYDSQNPGEIKFEPWSEWEKKLNDDIISTSI